ncbi:ABC transporter ATP-binding protein [Nitriliruptoraceae bacterium ZYF776]|nr:ABC transporter ATP-binding protein [Profundirhabdus halotolerans]
MLEVAALRHRYGDTVALDGVDLRISPGECVALLGPNGAGKTTAVDAVIGLHRTTGGSVRVLGGDPQTAAVRRRLGVVQQSVGFPATLRVAEIVRGAAVRAGVAVDRVPAALAEAGITDLAGRSAAKLSGGQQQRLQLAAALVTDPALLVLDEPTEGLDASARRAFWSTLARRRDGGTGILLTTHLVDEAASVADRVVVLDRGRVVASDTPDALTSRLALRTVTLRTDLAERELTALDDEVEVISSGSHVRLRTPHPERFLAALHAADPGYDDLRVEGASLEEALIQLTDHREEVPA